MQEQELTVKRLCVAIAPSRQLTILELKNVEDRGIVQQLTRYYSAVREAKPFAEQVDYEQSIRLMAIAPSVHHHNWIDREYSTLQLKFCQFEVIGTQEPGLSLQLQDLSIQQTYTQPISHLTFPVKSSEEGERRMQRAPEGSLW